MKATIYISDDNHLTIESPDVSELTLLHFFLATLSHVELQNTATYHQLVGLHDGMRFEANRREMESQLTEATK